MGKRKLKKRKLSILEREVQELRASNAELQKEKEDRMTRLMKVKFRDE